MDPPSERGVAVQHAVEVEADRTLELGVGARPRVPVGSPALPLGDMPEPVALKVVVADLGDEVRAEGDP
jgi:hypothetical protein